MSLYALPKMTLLLETKREMLSAKQSGDDEVDKGNTWAREQESDSRLRALVRTEHWGYLYAGVQGLGSASFTPLHSCSSHIIQAWRGEQRPWRQTDLSRTTVIPPPTSPGLL